MLERKQMSSDNRKAEAIKHLESAKEKWPTASQANQIKLAIARWHLDELGEKDPKTRMDVITAFMEMPSWFGASANSMMELDSYVKKAKRTVELPEGL